MTKQLQIWMSLLCLSAAIFWSLYGTRPQIGGKVLPEHFSVQRAFSHVKALSREPHFVGSENHRRVRNYIVNELEDLGLFVQTQEGYSVNKYGTLTRPQNIITRIEGTGNGKSLLLMSHYDSAMHSSFGASDAASGVATILEGLRAFRESGRKPVNDIVILFTDAEELGLNGAAIYVDDHPWAEDVGLALNFEARGSGGSSFMLLETNKGNKKLLQEFLKAGVEFPVSNSLVYSVYKMLPNDTDLTVLREQGNIDGLNFAFIDDHFDYHTATDVPENLDLRSLAHQGSYLMPLLEYFGSTPIEDMESEENLVFFNVPALGIVTYPYAWIYPMLIMAIAAFLLVVGFGWYRSILNLKGMVKGIIPLVLSLGLSGGLAYGLWKLVLVLYPHYLEMEQGFTYNGYYYISAVIFLSLAVCFYIYSWFGKKHGSADLFVAPLGAWILLAGLAAVYLKGAAYFIVPVFFGIVQLLLLFKKIRYQLFIQTILSLPSIFILTDFIIRFPVALGLKIVFVSAVLTVLLWVLLWPVIGRYRKIQLLGFASFLTFLVLFLIAHFKADFGPERPRPNSLVYLYDTDRNVATWNSYDRNLDSWNAEYFEKRPENVIQQPRFGSKYGTRFHHTAVAPRIDVPPPFIEVEKLKTGNEQEDAYRVNIVPQRPANRIELFLDRGFDFKDFQVNGERAPFLQPGESSLHVFTNRWSDRLLTYYPVNRDTLRLEMRVEEGQHPEITLFESAYTLFDHPELGISPRGKGMIPKPFVLNDAITIKTSFRIK